MLAYSKFFPKAFQIKDQETISLAYHFSQQFDTLFLSDLFQYHSPIDVSGNNGKNHLGDRFVS
jgi:hypothetical protein